VPQEPAPPQGDEEEDSDDEEFFVNLPMDAESEERAAGQRVVLASFETQRCDQSAQEFMAAERRAGVAEQHAAARTEAHRCNIEAARAAMAEAEQRLA
jgi:hypothetical protein